MAVIQPYVKIVLRPFDIINVVEMSIVKAPNAHTLLYMTAVVDERFQTSFATEELDNKPLQVIASVREKNSAEEVEKVLFCGKAESMAIVCIGNTYRLRLVAASHSKGLDIKKASRTFQKRDMTYKDVMTQAIDMAYEQAKEGNGGSLIDKATEGKTIDKLIVQYQETAWEFIKRMASHFGAPIVVEDKLEDVAVCIGMPEKADIGKLEEFRYTIRKNVAAYRFSTENGDQKRQENDYISYEIVTDSIYEIGDSATFLNDTYYIHQAIISIRNGKLYNRYRLSTKQGFYQDRIINSSIIGLTLEGVVEEVIADTVKVRLDIDKNNQMAANQTLYAFTYATCYTAEGSGGFYCMPEIGERVRICFPDENEENGFAQSCVRTDFETEGDHGNPDIKYFRTKDGKEIKVTPEGIFIICQDDEIFISLTEEKGITLQSSKPIQIVASEGSDISMSAEGSILLSAEKEIDIACNGSKINMKGGTTKIRGTSITEN